MLLSMAPPNPTPGLPNPAQPCSTLPNPEPAPPSLTHLEILNEHCPGMCSNMQLKVLRARGQVKKGS